jgi:hypothetical protein
MATNLDKIDPFASPMIFLRVGWMDRYQGLTGDRITGGGEFVKEHGYGHEIFNFQPFNNSVYGYVQPVRGGINQANGSTINTTRLGAAKGADSLSGVLAIWVATAPEGGSVIVGWYKNATIHRKWQSSPPGAGRDYKGESLGYYISAAEKDMTLLPKDKRLFQVPRGKGKMGQSNVWYADDPNEHRQLRLDVLNFVLTQQWLSRGHNKKLKMPHQPDPLLRAKVELAAVMTVMHYYTHLGYNVCSVESDNVGWDLTATFGRRELKLETKGLSGADTRVELTPNEYAKMKEHRDSYRVCIVTQALSSPQLAVFSYSKDSQRWEDETGRELNIAEIIAAHCKSP